jgi:cobalt/nickel transport system permease protein
MIIDEFCYHSKLRYENAGEKFAFAVITLCICVASRSITVACMVLASTGILTVLKGGVPVLRYMRLLTIPLAFLFLSTVAIIFHIKQVYILLRKKFFCLNNPLPLNCLIWIRKNIRD